MLKDEKKVQGFEVTQYSKPQEIFDKFAVIYSIVEDRQSDRPNHGVRVKAQGDQLQVAYHIVEMDLPQRINVVRDQVEECFKEVVKYVKKEYKSRTGKALDLKEDKDLRSEAVQKANLNCRYYGVYTRTYSLA